ncbi:TPA: phosphate acyltransferase PlsX [Streptococcus suis]|nr:phosphate acyltransferase PlsX [Streptococcus suis]NQI34311.1 phosphate acyltransferase PlsX [Streptococcus suis]NQP19527.1 phosphate acyltransferase PlsX [Streptococcus suis]
MKRIAIDAMGGDHAPQAVIEGVNQALKEFSDIEIQLYGDEAKIKPYLTATERVTIIHTDEKINSDDEPVRAIRRKKNSSMVLATQAVKDGQADAVLSAGNTGALLAAGVFVVGRIKNIDRPGLMSTLPTMDGKGFDMMDLGANAENTAHHLYQYGILGSFYAEHVRGVKNPRVALLNNGTEETKGTPVHQEAFALLSQEPSINFIGNVEARELLNGVADVVVTDGFTGNAVLKTVEGTAKSIVGQLTGAIKSGSFLAKIGGLLLKPTLKKALGALDYKTAGGAVLLGLKAPVIKAHGSSDATAIFYTIKQVRQILDANIVEKSVAKFSPVENNHD